MKAATLVLALFANIASFALGEDGVASWMSRDLAGKPTASGTPFNPDRRTAASWAHFKKWVKVTNLLNGREVIVWCDDRGPAKRLHRAIDLSPVAYWQIALPSDIRRGTMRVRITPLFQ